MGGEGGVGGVGGWGRNLSALSPLSPHTPHTPPSPLSPHTPHTPHLCVRNSGLPSAPLPLRLFYPTPSHCRIGISMMKSVPSPGTERQVN